MTTGRQGRMTTEQKRAAMRLFLDEYDCSATTETDTDPLTFSYTKGNSEGGYILIGGIEYRCHCATEESYLSAVAFYLTLR